MSRFMAPNANFTLILYSFCTVRIKTELCSKRTRENMKCIFFFIVKNMLAHCSGYSSAAGAVYEHIVFFVVAVNVELTTM